VANYSKPKHKLSTIAKRPETGFVLYHNWGSSTTQWNQGIADREKAKIALATGQKYTNPFGGFVMENRSDEQAANEDWYFSEAKSSPTRRGDDCDRRRKPSPKISMGTQMQLWIYLKRMTRSFGFALPGSIYEVLRH